jgi:hypothetical protein
MMMETLEMITPVIDMKGVVPQNTLVKENVLIQKLCLKENFKTKSH